MEEKEQHCSGTDLFQTLAIKWEAIKGTLVTNSSLIVGRGKGKGVSLGFLLDDNFMQHMMVFTFYREIFLSE